MNAAGGLLQTIANGIVGLVAGAFHAFGAVMQGILHALQSIFPGLLLPIVAFVVAIVVFWQFIKR